MILAAKCAPDEKILSDICAAKLKAAELYLSKDMVESGDRLAKLCNKFRLRYAVHAPNDSYNLDKLARFTEAVNAKILVLHNIYWDDEWADITSRFRGSGVIVCLENTFSVVEQMKFHRRYGIGRCLDIEHLQKECGGEDEQIFIELLKETMHLHMTGYQYGSTLWHTPIHHSPEHNSHILDLMKKTGYSGFVVSEARVQFQTLEEFRKLKGFFKKWES